MPRMRTISEAARYVRAADPETALTETAIRRLLINGSVPSVRVGVKYLIDLDALDAYLSGGRATKPEAV
jgi:excisionase family DNA binding protein